MEMEGSGSKGLFLWRAIQNGLTTSHEIARRIRTVSPRCTCCNSENEYTLHLLFFCTVSRATWFASQFTLRVEGLPLVFAEAPIMITSNLEAKDILIFCNTMWLLWKARNEELFASKTANPSDVIRRTRMMKVDVPKQQGMSRDPDPLMVPQRNRVILVDGSWDIKNRAGIGMGVYNRRGDLVYTRYDKIQSQDPFHTEALAMLQAMKYAIEEGNEGPFMCFSDSKNMVQAIQEEKIEGLPRQKQCRSASI